MYCECGNRKNHRKAVCGRCKALNHAMRKGNFKRLQRMGFTVLTDPAAFQLANHANEWNWKD